MSEKRITCFVMSPIGELGSEARNQADWVLNGLIKKALPENRFDIKRADVFAEPGMINDQVIRAIMEYDLAVADLTDANPNVYYELALRRAASKPVIHIAEDGSKLPFDTAGHRAFFYNTTIWQRVEQARADICSAAEAILKPGFTVSNPVTHARGMQKLSEAADSKEQILATLARDVASLKENQLDRLDVMEIAMQTTDAMQKAHNTLTWAGAGADRVRGNTGTNALSR